MREFNCGNCRYKINEVDLDYKFVSYCGKDEARSLFVDNSDYCSKHLHSKLTDYQKYEEYKRINNTLLSY